MISLRQVSKAYYGNSHVLKSVNLQLGRGEFLFIVGESGAGKTTLLKILAGEELPSSGQALFDNKSIIPSGSQYLQFRRRIGVVHQDYRLLKDRTVFENVAIPLFYGRAGSHSKPLSFTGSGAQRLVEEAVSAVGLSNKVLPKIVSELSGGEQQRVAIARAIINHPDFLIADEPTGSLDHDHTWTVMDLLQKLNLKGMGIVVATHDQDIVRRIRRKTGLLQSGSLRFDQREGACIF